MPSPHGHITLTGSIDVSLAADLAAMIRALTAAVALTAWIAIRLAAPAWRLHLPRPLDLAWRFLVPPAALLLAASDMPTLSVVLAVAFASAHRFGTRTVGTLRREVHAEARAFETALHHAGRPATFDEVALCVLLGRFAGHSMARAEAAVLAGRCADLDELGAQVALRQGGMSTYAAYVRRYGRILDVADADTAARRDRFPDGTPG